MVAHVNEYDSLGRESAKAVEKEGQEWKMIISVKFGTHSSTDFTIFKPYLIDSRVRFHCALS